MVDGGNGGPGQVADLRARIEVRFERYKARRDRAAFKQSCFDALDDAHGLDDAARAALEEHVEQLANDIPAAETTDAELATAFEICRDAGERLRTSPRIVQLCETWPSPIAHEIQALIDRLVGSASEPPTPDGALMQLRDVVEVMVRLPAIVMARVLIEQGGEHARWARRAVFSAVGGQWLELGRGAYKRLDGLEVPVSIRRLGLCYDPSDPLGRSIVDLVQARNDYLGHSGTRPDREETAGIVRWLTTGGAIPKNEPNMRQVTTLLAGLESAVDRGLWSGLSLDVRLPQGLPFGLNGSHPTQQWLQSPHAHAHDGTVLPVVLHIEGGADVALAPFVTARQCLRCGKRDIFLFDSTYDGAHGRFDLQDYARGHKSRTRQDTGADLHRELQALSDGPLPNADVHDDDSLDSGQVRAYFDELRIDHRYLSPSYLRQELRDFLLGHKKGLFWLTAPAHVGKTTFVHGLVYPELQDGEIVPGLNPGEGRDRRRGRIASFLCKREYREGGVGFLNMIGESLRNALDVPSDRNAAFPEPQSVVASGDLRRGFARYIDDWRALSPDPKGKLLIVLDGLDEADEPGTGTSVLDFVPRPDELAEGVYVLVTSRRPADADCPDWVGYTLEPLVQGAGTRRFSIDVTAPEGAYRSLLHEYIRRRGVALNDADLADQIVQAAGGLFLYVAFLTDEIAAGRRTVQDLVAVSTTGPMRLFDQYLDRLDQAYGHKLAEDLRIVLAVLAAAEAAHHWFFEAGAQPDLATVPLGQVRAWAQAMLRGENPPLPEGSAILEPFPREWAGLDIDILAEIAEMDRPPDRTGRRFGGRLVRTLFYLQGSLGIWRGAEGQPRYRIGLKGLLSVIERREEFMGLLTRMHQRLAHAALDTADALAQQPSEDGLERWHKLGPRLAGHVALAGSEPIKKRFEGASVILALWLGFDFAYRHQKLTHAIDWQTVSTHLSQAMAYQEVTEYLDNLATAYTNRGVAKQDAEGHGPRAAIADHDQAIGILEALRALLEPQGEWGPALRDTLAMAYMNRGDAKQDAEGHGPRAAIADHDQAIGIWEALRALLEPQGEWGPALRDNLAMAYTNRGKAKQDAEGHGPRAAIADYDRAIGIWEALRALLEPQGEWGPALRDKLAVAYMNRGNAKQDAKGHGPNAAIADHDQAIDIWEALRALLEPQGEWGPALRDNLAGAYMNRGNAKQDAEGHGPRAAIADYDQAIGIREALRTLLEPQGEWGPALRDKLATAYMNRGVAKQDAEGHGPRAAIADHDQAIDIWEALRALLEPQGEWGPALRDNLAVAYMNRGNAKQDAKGHGPRAAIADHDQAIDIWEALRALLEPQGEWGPALRDNLAKAYMNRGVAKQDAEGHGPNAAIADHDQAIGIREALRALLEPQGEWGPALRDNLAKAYMNRGVAKQDAEGHGPRAAIADYDQAIGIREALHALLEPQGEWGPALRDTLAGAYMNRGNAKQDAEGHGPNAAIADYDQAIGIREALRALLEPQGEWGPALRDTLAMAYMNRGDAKQNAEGHGPRAAIADHDQAIDIWEALRALLEPQGEWGPALRDNLAMAYMNRGVAKQDAEGHGPRAAIADYDQAIGIWEALRALLEPQGEWGLALRDNLAGAYTNRGVAKQDAEGHGPRAAIADHDQAIGIWEALRALLEPQGEWGPALRDKLAVAYMNRGNAKQDAKGHGPNAAIADHDQAIDIWEALRALLEPQGEWGPALRDNLAKAYMNCGVAKLGAGHGPKAAIADYDQAIGIWEALRALLEPQGEWGPALRDNLAKAYMNRGLAKQDAEGHGPKAAIADHDQAIGILEALRALLEPQGEWGLALRDNLAGAYMNRGLAKQDAEGHGPRAAIADHDQAIGIREALRALLEPQGEWGPALRDTLAGAYMNRGNAKQDAEGHGPRAAIADYDQAIGIREALRTLLEPQGEWGPALRDNLATAYMNRGVAKQDAEGHGPRAAIADYDQAIDIWEALRALLEPQGEWGPALRDNLAMAYTNRGNAKQDAEGHGPKAAIADYDQAIGIREALRALLEPQGEWGPALRDNLAGAYMNRGNAKQDAEGNGPRAAIADHDQAIGILEALRALLEPQGEWGPALRDNLAMAYTNRGNAKQDAKGHGPKAASADYDQAIDIWEALRSLLAEAGYQDPQLEATLARARAIRDQFGRGE